MSDSVVYTTPITRFRPEGEEFEFEWDEDVAGRLVLYKRYTDNYGYYESDMMLVPSEIVEKLKGFLDD